MFPILLGKNNDLEKRVKTLEDSGGGGGSSEILIVGVNGVVLDKTWKEIKSAKFSLIASEAILDGVIYSGYSIVVGFTENSGESSYSVFVLGDNGTDEYITDNENGYPELA